MTQKFEAWPGSGETPLTHIGHQIMLMERVRYEDETWQDHGEMSTWSHERQKHY